MNKFRRPKSTREKIQDNINYLESFLKKYSVENEVNNLAVVFDVGTNSIRALVGPKMNLEEFIGWNPDFERDKFVTLSLHTKMGASFKKNYGIIDYHSDVALSSTILFIRAIKEKLSFIKDDNFVMVGTAVFRWLANQIEVLEHIKVRTGLELEVITEYQEAYYSLLAIRLTHNKIYQNKFKSKSFEKNDVILLLDQGGGSTEISYSFPLSKSDYKLTSMFHIGLVHLRNKFFEKFNNADLQTKSNITIRESLNSLKNYIEGQIDGIYGFDEILPPVTGEPNQYNIKVFGMGTGIKVCFEQHFGSNASKFKGWEMGLAEIRFIYKKVEDEIIQKFETVENIDRIGSSGAFNNILDSKLKMLYTLKTYEEVLRKFDVGKISYAYYNLRYGVFIKNFVEGVESLSKENTKQNTQLQNDDFKSAIERINMLSAIENASKDTDLYHNYVISTLPFIFNDRLANPKIDTHKNNNPRSCNVVFDNISTDGFFSRLNRFYLINGKKVFVEIRDSNTGFNNPNLENLVERLEKESGNFGILICRLVTNKKLLIERCREIRKEKGVSIIYLSDSDLKVLLNMKEFSKGDELEELISDKFEEIIQ